MMKDYSALNVMCPFCVEQRKLTMRKPKTLAVRVIEEDDAIERSGLHPEKVARGLLSSPLFSISLSSQRLSRCAQQGAVSEDALQS